MADERITETHNAQPHTTVIERRGGGGYGSDGGDQAAAPADRGDQFADYAYHSAHAGLELAKDRDRRPERGDDGDRFHDGSLRALAQPVPPFPRRFQNARQRFQRVRYGGQNGLDYVRAHQLQVVQRDLEILSR